MLVDRQRELVSTPSVWPSGGEVAICVAASMVAAPGLFSTTTGLPSAADSFSA